MVYGNSQLAGLADIWQSERLLWQIVDRAPMLLFVRDLNGRFTMVNQLYEQLSGLKREEVVGRTPYDIFPEARALEYLSHDRQVIETGKAQHFEESSCVNGVERFWLALKMPLWGDDGRLIGVAGMSTEITERKRIETELRQLNQTLEEANRVIRKTQEQLIQAEKMESVGRLAAGVAHEVKNPLALILMGVEYLSQGTGPDDPNVGVILDEMRKAVGRAEKIIHGMVDFSASRQLEIRMTDVNTVIMDTLPFIKHDRDRSGVELELRLASNLPPVALDVQKFEQVLLNLFLNSIQAMADRGGRLTVWSRREVVEESDPVDPGNRGAESRWRAGNEVVVVGVEDTGRGIAPADLERIFDPFFTTKPTGVGTGLGLSIARKIIELHGGRISARSEVGKGTRMLIALRAGPGLGGTPGGPAGNVPERIILTKEANHEKTIVGGG